MAVLWFAILYSAVLLGTSNAAHISICSTTGTTEPTADHGHNTSLSTDVRTNSISRVNFQTTMSLDKGSSVRRVNSQNRKNLGYKLELNGFADWTEDELMSLRGALPSKEDDPGSHPFPHTLEEIDKLVEGIPDEYDLRIEGDLPAIKNQQACGSCWAFATTATVEAAIIKHLGGVQLDLSEQSLVDCGWPYGTLGCNGGFLNSAFKYVKEHGIPTEAEYGGYMHEDGYCHVNDMSKIYKIKGYTRVTPHSINAVKYAVYTYGPVEVTMHASDDMHLYSSGIFYDMSCINKHLNHAVVVVGYGSEGGEPYWIIRNSWGETWGEDGYILMSAKDNNCLVLDWPYYPVV